MSIKLSNRLFFRQTRNAIFVALTLGIVISVGQIIFDFYSEQKRIDETVHQVLNTTKESASQAAYSLNNELALRVVKGLFEYQPIYSAQINDDFGRQLASLERPPIKHDMEWLGPMIRTDQNLYTVPLYAVGGQTVIGEMRVLVDRFLIAQNFLDRAGLVILTGIFRNLILAIFFGFLFYFTLGRPVMQTIQNLATIDPNQPGKTHLHTPAGHHEDELGLLVRKLNSIMADFDDTLQQRYMAEDELKRNQNTIRQLNLRLEERVRQRTSELETANKEMEAFTYSVSHDLRAPLRTIGGFSNILQEEYSEQLDEQAQHYIERVHLGTQKMERLINDLLKLSRTTRGEMHRKDFNLSALADEIITELRQNEPERDISVHISPNLKAYGDQRLVRIMLENLLGNAWKYTQLNDEPSLFLGLTDKNGQETFYIQDNGAGFDMNYADKLFTPFQRLHSSKEFDGTGVGLATVQRIIHRHGGEIWADALVGKGATFYFTLPRPFTEFSA
ncbi:putative Histidine kinase [Candidatus Terasakiella magnetica]|uniref:histidine kinase n=1 Tax=Candidatus Terasakiella magnetica TaxID=1867952 RepID=A0A1C3RF33_9PROT|nr:ATP-binding protein [Candidatus Terasakiella magnetica]SCA55842.1 putative Histidine kinase [Candidatus Terasakiella magnetica]